MTGFLDELLASKANTPVSSTVAGVAPSFTAGTPALLKTDGSTASWGTVQPALLDSGIPVAKLGSYVAGDAGKVLTINSSGTVVASSSVIGELCVPLGQMSSSGSEFTLSGGYYSQTSIAAPGSLSFPLRVEIGRRITQVKIYIQPGVHTAMPATKPIVDFQRRLFTGTSIGSWAAVNGFVAVTDPLTDFAAYNNLHAITLTSSIPGGTEVVTGYEYKVKLYGESGTNSVTGLTVLEAIITYAV